MAAKHLWFLSPHAKMWGSWSLRLRSSPGRQQRPGRNPSRTAAPQLAGLAGSLVDMNRNVAMITG